MKISFIRIENSKLPEPYTGLSTDILYLTSTGYVYPEGSDKPIDIFDPSVLDKLSDGPITTIDDKPKIKIEATLESPLVHETIRQNLDLLSYIKHTRYCYIRGIAEVIGADWKTAKEKINLLSKMGIIQKYASCWVLADDVRAIIEFELENRGC